MNALQIVPFVILLPGDVFEIYYVLENRYLSFSLTIWPSYISSSAKRSWACAIRSPLMRQWFPRATV